MKEKIIDKILSGRFLLTIMIGTTTCILALRGVFKPEDWKAIALIVLYAYFTRKRKEEE